MMNTSLEKRIKRRIIGRDHIFFAATAPGIEKLCQQELKNIGIKDASVTAGGVLFNARLKDCFRANLLLRTANRILMRMTTFKATNFRQFDRQMAKIPWELYLPTGYQLNINVTSKNSRLYHKGALAEHAAACIRSRVPDQSGLNPQNIFIRVIEDRLTLSLDSSGELLHKRGLKTTAACAPLRATIAAAALQLAGFNPDEPLIDPMCGSGTFAIECSLWSNRIPPGWFRDFAFMYWPGFKLQQWNYLRGQLRQNFSVTPLANIFASDHSQRACQSLRTLADTYELKNINIQARNFFKLNPGVLTKRLGLVILNPPYGLRLNQRAQYSEIFKYLKHSFQGWKVGIFLPDQQALHALPERLQFKQYILPHGGTRRIFVTIPG